MPCPCGSWKWREAPQRLEGIEDPADTGPKMYVDFGVHASDGGYKVSVPRGYLSIDGVSSDGTRAATFIIAKKKTDDLQRSGPPLKFLELSLVKDALGSPDVIFQDLKREDLRDSYCYSKVPAFRKLSSTIKAPFPPDLVFLVFVNRDHRRPRHPRLGKKEE